MSPPVERSWAKEAPRDLVESAFTPILRRLLHRTTGVLAVCFVDSEGECVDYASSLPPFESKVAGAQMTVTLWEVAESMQRVMAGRTWHLHVHSSNRDVVARRVNDEYLLVVVLKPRALTRRLLGGIEQTVIELRREAGVDTPDWEPISDSVRVEVRDAIGWAYAPAAFFDESATRVEIAHVMGRWTEGTDSRVCFRVQTEDGEELTLVHDRALDRWERL